MFSKETEYALRCLVYIQVRNLGGRKPGVEEISSETEAPRFFAAKILHRMVKSGFLRSSKGKGGGFFFDKEKPSPRLIELIEAIEGNKIISGCVFGFSHCNDNNPCPMHEKYVLVRDAMKEILTSETVMSLALKHIEIQNKPRKTGTHERQDKLTKTKRVAKR